MDSEQKDTKGPVSPSYLEEVFDVDQSPSRGDVREILVNLREIAKGCPAPVFFAFLTWCDFSNFSDLAEFKRAMAALMEGEEEYPSKHAALKDVTTLVAGAKVEDGEIIIKAHEERVEALERLEDASELSMMSDPDWEAFFEEHFAEHLTS